MSGGGGNGAIPYSYVRGVSGGSVNSLPGDLLLGGGGERAARLDRIPHAAGLRAGVLAAALRSRPGDEACVGACLRLLTELQLVRLDLKHTELRFIRKKHTFHAVSLQHNHTKRRLHWNSIMTSPHLICITGYRDTSSVQTLVNFFSLSCSFPGWHLLLCIAHHFIAPSWLMLDVVL